jgi:peroxiredoxin family protein
VRFEVLTNTKKLAIIVESGTLDKLYCAFILGSTAVAMDWECHFYFTFFGLTMLRKDEMDKAGLDATHKNLEENLRKRLEAMKYPTPYQMLKQMKQSGRSFIYACTPTMNMFNIKKEDLIPEVDKLAGAAQFLEVAADADVTLFI